MDSWKTKYIFPAIGMIPIDRSGGDAAERALNTAARVIEAGEFFGIYPEGTRARDGRLHRGRTGAARLALRTGAPIIPVGIKGTREIQPPDAKLPRPFKPAEVHFGARSRSARYIDRADDRLVPRQIIDEVMFEIRELTGQEYVDEYASKKAEGIPAAETAQVVELDGHGHRRPARPRAAGPSLERRGARAPVLTPALRQRVPELANTSGTVGPHVRADHGPVARWFDARVGHRHHRGWSGPGHRLPPGQGGRDRRRERRGARPHHGAPRRRRGGDHHRRQRPRPVHDPPLHRARAGPGGARPVPRGHLRHRAAGGGRLLLRLRAPRRRPLRRGRPRAGRRADARDHRGVPAVRPRRAARRQGARGVRRPPLQARDHRRRQHRPDVGHVVVGVGPHLREPAGAAEGRRRPSTATPASSTCAGARTCPTPASTSATSS